MSILASDNFTRANNGDLGTSWDPCTGETSPGGFVIISNTARAADITGDSSESNNAATWPNDQYCTVVISLASADGAGTGPGPMCRSATTGADPTTKTYYRLIVNSSGYEFARKVAGAFTSLSSGAGTTFTATDSATLEVRTNGATCDWVLKKNGTSFTSGNDATPITSGRPGVAYSSTSSDQAHTALTSWEGGDFGGATVASQKSKNPFQRLSPKFFMEATYQGQTPATPATFIFRKTLSGIGTKTGSRQTHNT